MQPNESIRAALNAVLALFESGEIPEAIALASFHPFDVPSAVWSLLNRTLAAIQGTVDARGFRQWKEAGRHVVKGAKAFPILAPRIKTHKETNEKGEEVRKSVVIGFLAVPVFRVEDTEGRALEYQKLELPPLPLLDRAEQWGLSTRAVCGNVDFYGKFAPSRQEIVLASPEECVFFHELSHAAHHRIRPLKGGQVWSQEIVAELSAAVLCRLVGRQPLNQGQHYRYISHYAEKAGLDAVKACLEVFADVEKVLELILGQE